MTISAGSGGAEAESFAAMLLRMYTRWAKKHAIDVEDIDVTATDAGIKSVLLRFTCAFGELAGEAGVHRLQRVSPFGGGERHTSFAVVEVIEETPPSLFTLDERELRETFTRGSGPGGQNRNKVATAVVLRHVPTGITVAITNGRSQWQNRQTARTVMSARVAARQTPGSARSADGQGPSWGRQRRTYTLSPRALVKDAATGITSSDAKRVLDGDIDRFLAPSRRAQARHM